MVSEVARIFARGVGTCHYLKDAKNNGRNTNGTHFEGNLGN